MWDSIMSVDTNKFPKAFAGEKEKDGNKKSRERKVGSRSESPEMWSGGIHPELPWLLGNCGLLPQQETEH